MKANEDIELELYCMPENKNRPYIESLKILAAQKEFFDIVEMRETSALAQDFWRRFRRLFLSWWRILAHMRVCVTVCHCMQPHWELFTIKIYLRARGFLHLTHLRISSKYVKR